MDVDEDIEKDVNTAVDADDGLYFDCCCLSCHHWCVVCAIVNGIFESESMGSTIFLFFSNNFYESDNMDWISVYASPPFNASFDSINA